MDYGAMIAMRDKLIAERDAVDNLIVALDQTIEVFRRLGSPIGEPYYEPPPKGTALPKTRRRRTGSGEPTGAEAVYRVLQDAPGVEMDVKAILASLNEHGWAPNSKWPENVTSSNAARAVEVHPDELSRRRVGPGFLYTFVPARFDPGPGLAALHSNGHYPEEVSA